MFSFADMESGLPLIPVLDVAMFKVFYKNQQKLMVKIIKI